MLTTGPRPLLASLVAMLASGCGPVDETSSASATPTFIPQRPGTSARSRAAADITRAYRQTTGSYSTGNNAAAVVQAISVGLHGAALECAVHRRLDEMFGGGPGATVPLVLRRPRPGSRAALVSVDDVARPPRQLWALICVGLNVSQPGESGSHMSAPAGSTHVADISYDPDDLLGEAAGLVQGELCIPPKEGWLINRPDEDSGATRKTVWRLVPFTNPQTSPIVFPRYCPESVVAWARESKDRFERKLQAQAEVLLGWWRAKRAEVIQTFEDWERAAREEVGVQPYGPDS